LWNKSTAIEYSPDLIVAPVYEVCSTRLRESSLIARSLARDVLSSQFGELYDRIRPVLGPQSDRQRAEITRFESGKGGAISSKSPIFGSHRRSSLYDAWLHACDKAVMTSRART
jgi:hypothetical protein